MAQRILFPVLPKVEDAYYFDKLNRLLLFIDEQRPSQQELREFMQEQEIWDRELLSGEFWEFYGIIKEKRYKLGKLGGRLLDARRDLTAEREILFKHILQQNPILIKYIFDALMERLHSDAELYRYLTSYVYPGKKLRRPDFLNLMRLLILSGFVRILGIRYALSDEGREAMRQIEQIDVESILEEERMELSGDEAEEAAEEAAIAEAIAKVSRKRTSEDRGRAIIRDDDQEAPRRRTDEEDAPGEDDDRPRSKARRDDEEDDDRPRSKARRDDDEDDDQPRSKARRDDDEEKASQELGEKERSDEEAPPQAGPASARSTKLPATPPAPSKLVTEELAEPPAASTSSPRQPEPRLTAAEQSDRKTEEKREVERDRPEQAPRSRPAPKALPRAALPEEEEMEHEEEEEHRPFITEFRPAPRRKAPRPTTLFGPKELAENLERLRSWWDEYEHRQLRHASDFNVSALEYELAPQSFLLKLLSLATLIIGDPREADRWSFVNRLDRIRFFPRLMESGAELYPLLAELDFLAGDPGHRMLAENLLTLLRHREQLFRQPDLAGQLATMQQGREVITLLRTTFFDDSPSAQPYWIVREMVQLGLWKADGLRSVAAVPQRPTRQAAFRLGLLETPFARDDQDLLVASRGISAVLGPELGFDEPLFHLAAALGCRSGCPHVESCSYHCRERFDLP